MMFGAGWELRQMSISELMHRPERARRLEVCRAGHAGRFTAFSSSGRGRCSYASVGEHSGHPRTQRCLPHSIRASIAVVVMSQEFGKALSGAVDPALDRADLGATDHSRFLVTEPFGSDQ